MFKDVFCLPFAGAGPSFFYPWRRLGFEGIDIVPMPIPGRERRLDDAPFADMTQAAESLATDAEAMISGAPVAIYGHSMGAVLAFEIARRLEGRSPGSVTHLFVSGSQSPWDQRTQRATGLSDDEFVAQIEDFAGFRHEAFDVPELRDLLLPTLRADVEMHESYSPPEDGHISAPVTSIRGTDDALVSLVSTKAWARATTGRYEHHEVEGDHMFIESAPERLLALVQASATGRQA